MAALSAPGGAPGVSSSVGGGAPAPSRRLRRFETALAAESVEKKALAELAWSGVPAGASRCEVWQLLLDYRPLARERRDRTLQRKRQEYRDLRSSLYEASPVVSQSQGIGSGHVDAEGLLLRQIRKDLPRTQVRFAGDAADGPQAAEVVARSPQVHDVMERVLFIWAVRQPASGYVQGIDGIVLFVLLTFLAEREGCEPAQMDMKSLEHIGEEQLGEVEADCYWCVSKILSEIYDHYTEGFPGIQRMAVRMMDLLKRIDAPLAAHLEAQDINMFQVTLQWMGCLMVRELCVTACARLWDTLIAESAQAATGDRGGADRSSAGFGTLLLYFCVCFLARFSARLRSMDLEAINLFFNRTPSDALSEAEVEVLISEAFVMKSLFHQAPSHLSA